MKSERQLKNERQAQDDRKMLINAARNGDQAAIETLTLDDTDTDSKVVAASLREMYLPSWTRTLCPYGEECDLYSIIGEILAVTERQNTATGVKLYQMKRECENESEIRRLYPCGFSDGRAGDRTKIQGNDMASGVY